HLVDDRQAYRAYLCLRLWARNDQPIAVGVICFLDGNPKRRCPVVRSDAASFTLVCSLLVRARTETRIRALYQTRRTGFSVGMGGESRPWFWSCPIGPKGLIWGTGTVSKGGVKSVAGC